MSRIEPGMPGSPLHSTPVTGRRDVASGVASEFDRALRVPPVQRSDAVSLTQLLRERFANAELDGEQQRLAFRALTVEQVPGYRAREAALLEVLAQIKGQQQDDHLQELIRGELQRLIPLNAMAVNLLRNPFKVEVQG